MAPNPRRVRERLAAIYARLPSVECRGLCAEACTAIDMSVRERLDLEGAAGHPCQVDGQGKCNMLANGRCTQYELRPLICRMWGAVESMPCPHGCQADPAPMPDKEAFALLADAMQVGGAPAGVYQRVTGELVKVMMNDPELSQAATRIARQGWSEGMHRRFGA
jgi:uncharacterized protein